MFRLAYPGNALALLLLAGPGWAQVEPTPASQPSSHPAPTSQPAVDTAPTESESRPEPQFEKEAIDATVAAPEATDATVTSPEEQTSILSWGAPVGAVSGCVACGLAPDAVAVGGIGFFLLVLEEAGRNDPLGGCLLVVLFGLAPLAVGLASAAVAGLSAPCGVAAGSSIGAGMSGRPFWAPLVGAAPGLLIGLAGSALIVASLTVLSDPRLFPDTDPTSNRGGAPPTDPLLITGLIAALAAGPIALVGAIGADMAIAATGQE